MAGQFFEHESLMFGPCGCVIARDESTQKHPDHHVLHMKNARFVVKCPEHEAAGSSPLDYLMHYTSEGVAVRAIVATLPVSSLKEDGEPKEPVRSIMNIQSGHIAFSHPDMHAGSHDAARNVLANEKLANLSLVEHAHAATVFAAHDAMFSEHGHGRFWQEDQNGIKIVSASKAH